MALALATPLTPPSSGANTAVSYALGTPTANGPTDHADIIGYVSRVYIHVDNGAANPVVWGVDGSHDGTNWFEIGWRRSTGTFATTDVTTTAAVKEAVFLAGTDCPRFVRVNVTTANANGSAFVLLAEK